MPGRLSRAWPGSGRTRTAKRPSGPLVVDESGPSSPTRRKTRTDAPATGRPEGSTTRPRTSIGSEDVDDEDAGAGASFAGAGRFIGAVLMRSHRDGRIGRAPPRATTSTAPLETIVATASTPAAASFSRVSSRRRASRPARAATVSEVVPPAPTAAAIVTRASAAGTEARAGLTGGQGGGDRSRRDSAASEADAQMPAGLEQPVPQGRLGPSQSTGGLVVRQALKVAEDHRQAVPIGQAVELLVDDRRKVGIGSVVGGVEHGHGGPGLLAMAPPPGAGGLLDRRAIGDAVQPAGQRVPGADRPRLAGQHQEGGLEGVLDVVLVPERGAAGGQDHRPVPRDDRLEGRLVAIGGEAGQELAVAEADGRAAAEQVAEVPQGASQRASGHGGNP